MPGQHDKEGRVKCQIQVFPPPAIILSLMLLDGKLGFMSDLNVLGVSVSGAGDLISGGRR
jgi:hypothetical protein